MNQTIALSRRLLTRAGEADGTKVATRLASILNRLDADDLLHLFRWMVLELGPDRDALVRVASTYLSDPTVANAARVTVVAEPRRQELLRRLNAAAGGTALIVTLRGKLLSMLRNQPELEPLDTDMRHLLASWFNRGFLELRRIDWQTSATILEKLIAYEAVHAISDWNDLRGRLSGDRRCYGFFHPALPGEPLIFVEVALTDRISDAVGPLLAHPPVRAEPNAPTAAIFYSISNCQQGLRGISFGNFLIKQIALDLKAETPSLDVFATLSPVPGFRRWLDANGMEASNGIVGERADGDLARLCALYLTRLPSDISHEQARDSVAAFHLSNGARLERINLDADLSEKGLRESHGIMVNYRYLPEAIESNHEAFLSRGHVSVSPQVGAMIDNRKRTRARFLRPYPFIRWPSAGRRPPA